MNVREKPKVPENPTVRRFFSIRDLNLQEVNDRIEAEGVELEGVIFRFDLEHGFIAEYYEHKYSALEMGLLFGLYQEEVEEWKKWLDENRESIIKEIEKEEQAEIDESTKVYKIRKRYNELKNKYTK